MSKASKDRDFISEIKEIRDRHPSERRAIFDKRIKDIRLLIDLWLTQKQSGDNEKCRSEALRYIPIALAAAMQGYLRFAIRDLVNHGEPFSSNARKAGDIRITYDLLMGIAEKKT